MIASVVATLVDVDGNLQSIIDQLTAIPSVEIGAFRSDARRIPITIDSTAPNALEETTGRIQKCCGVAFVDVVFVHFDDPPESPSVARTGKPYCS